MIYCVIMNNRIVALFFRTLPLMKFQACFILAYLGTKETTEIPCRLGHHRFILHLFCKKYQWYIGRSQIRHYLLWEVRNLLWNYHFCHFYRGGGGLEAPHNTELELYFYPLYICILTSESLSSSKSSPSPLKLSGYLWRSFMSSMNPSFFSRSRTFFHRKTGRYVSSL